jgi:hypothetical protein
MTVIGKILVFLILVLAVAQAALHLMFHITQTNWKVAYDKVTAQYTALDAEYKAVEAERNQAADEKKKSIDAKDAELKTKDNDLAQLKATIDTLNGQLQAEREKVTKYDATVAGSNSDITRREEEVKRLEDTVKANNDRIKELVDTGNQLRDRAVAAEIDSKSLKERNSNLMQKLEETSKELIQTKNGTGGVGLTASAKNPPPENVEGTVTQADNSGLVTLNVGSDDGLLKGHTLEVFHMNPPRYLGTVRIIQVTPHQAVAQPVSWPLGPIQQGDRVASKS